MKKILRENEKLVEHVDLHEGCREPKRKLFIHLIMRSINKSLYSNLVEMNQNRVVIFYRNNRYNHENIRDILKKLRTRWGFNYQIKNASSVGNYIVLYPQ